MSGGEILDVNAAAQGAVDDLASYKWGFVSDIESERAPKGLSEDTVRYISAKKGEPDWLLDWRLKAYRRWLTMTPPDWAKLDIAPIDYQDAYYYAAPKAKPSLTSLDELDPEIRRTYEKLGIPIEEQKMLAGVEGSRRVGERAVLLCGAADPRFIERREAILGEVAQVVRDLVCEDAQEDYSLFWRFYGVDGVTEKLPDAPIPGEIFLTVECIAPTTERASEVVRTMKQYLLHYGYEGRLSTGGNLAFAFTPPEISVGTAYRFNVYHIMRSSRLAELFPLTVEQL